MKIIRVSSLVYGCRSRDFSNGLNYEMSQTMFCISIDKECQGLIIECSNCFNATPNPPLYHLFFKIQSRRT